MGISLTAQADAFAVTPKLIFVPIWNHYAKVWGNAAFFKGLLNSVLAALLGKFMAFAIGIPAAFALNQSLVPARGAIPGRLPVSYMLPEFLFVIPMYGLFRATGLFDSVFGLALVHQTFPRPFTLWMMRAILAEVPFALCEAARLEGAKACRSCCGSICQWRHRASQPRPVSTRSASGTNWPERLA